MRWEVYTKLLVVLSERLPGTKIGGLGETRHLGGVLCACLGYLLPMSTITHETWVEAGVQRLAPGVEIGRLASLWLM